MRVYWYILAVLTGCIFLSAPKDVSAYSTTTVVTISARVGDINEGLDDNPRGISSRSNAAFVEVTFKGVGIPGTTVVILKDGVIVGRGIVTEAGDFLISLKGISSGNYVFGVFAEDLSGRRSALVSIPVDIPEHAVISIENIRVLPLFSQKLYLPGDLNKDGHVNVLDFSIMKHLYAENIVSVDADLNQDGKIDLIDFSIQAFYWTG